MKPEKRGISERELRQWIRSTVLNEQATVTEGIVIIVIFSFQIHFDLEAPVRRSENIVLNGAARTIGRPRPTG